MKKLILGIFLCLAASIIIYSCKPEHTYPSPLEGVAVGDQTFESGETSRTIEVGSRLEDVTATSIDMATNVPPRWLNVNVGKTSIELRLQENVTINDRKARVTLSYTGSRSDLSNADATVIFYVEQKKNKMFDNFNIEEVSMGYSQADTTVATGTVLKNVKAVVSDEEGQALTWCTVRVSNTDLYIKVSENRNKTPRQAFIRLLPNTDSQEETDSTIAKTMFYVLQGHNPVLDDLDIEEVVMSFEDGKKVVKTDRLLKGVKAMVVDDETQERSTWSTATVAGDSVSLHVNKLTGKTDRSAQVTLYWPNNGSIIDSTTIAYTFKLKQTHNSVLEGVTIKDRQVKYNQTADTMKLSYSLKDFKAKIVDPETREILKWLTAVVNDSLVILKPGSSNMAKNDRSALVTLYQPNNGEVVDSTTISISFMLTQLHNDAVDELTIDAQKMKYNQTVDTLKVKANLKGFRVKLKDIQTEQTPLWMEAQVKENAVVFKSKAVNTSKNDRSAIVTIYQPTNGDVIDENTISLSFKLTQLHNDAIDSLKIGNQQMVYDQEADTVKVKSSLKGFKVKMMDTATEQAPKWMEATVGENAIFFKSKATNTSINDRSAIVTLYQPTNGDVIDENTISTTFKITQKHNDATDTLDIKDRSVAYNQTADSLMVKCSLKGFKSVTVDLNTQLKPTWLTTTVSENKIVFKTGVNNSLQSRSARVTIYQPNGSSINENTIQHSFLITQDGKKQLIPETTSLETDYSNHTAKIKITSNVKYQIEKDAAQWVLAYKMVPIDDLHEELQVDLAENKTIETRSSTLTLSSGNLTATITIKQLTNPAITILDGITERVVFDKTGGELLLNIQTLTTNYSMSKKADWFDIGKRQTEGYGLFSHKVVIKSFNREGPTRVDTIVVKNNYEQKKLAVFQHNYLYFTNAEVEVEEGKQIKLSISNHTTRAIAWSSRNKSVATVDQTGMVTAIKSGKAEIKASIGEYYDVVDYNDICKVTVYNASDKLTMTWGTGNYVKNGDYVTTDRPFTLTNTYDGAVTINSVILQGNDGEYLQSIQPKNVLLNRDSQQTFTYTGIERVYQPTLVVQMTSNNKVYSKTFKMY